MLFSGSFIPKTGDPFSRLPIFYRVMKVPNYENKRSNGVFSFIILVFEIRVKTIKFVQVLRYKL